jgi:hypothetical protein
VQERPVPATKGWSPVAPAGGHKIQAGTLVETPAVPVADDPPAVVRADDVLPAAPNVLDWVPLADPVAVEDPLAEPPVGTAVPVAEPADAAAAPVVAAELVCVAMPVGKLAAP